MNQLVLRSGQLCLNRCDDDLWMGLYKSKAELPTIAGITPIADSRIAQYDGHPALRMASFFIPLSEDEARAIGEWMPELKVKS